MSGAPHHLTLRGTFIDIEEQEVDLSPRAHSDPGPSRRQDLFFEDQQKYIERLDEMYHYDSLATQQPEPLVLGVASECGDHALRSYQLRAITPLQTWQRPAAIAPREPAQEAGAAWLLGRRGCKENLAQDKKDSYALGRAATLTTYREEPDHSDGLACSDVDAPPRSPSAARQQPESGWARGQKLPGGVHAGFPLSALVGTWRVVESSLCEEGLWTMEEGLWTIQESGRALFNGKHFGADYDISVRCPEGGVAQVQRGDGWVVDLHSSSVDRLVWRKAGEAVQIMWARAAVRPPQADAAEAGSPCREDKRELWSKMQASAQQMCQGWSCEGRLANAIAVMEDAVFKRICEDMQRAASFIVDNMQAEVSAMRREIRKDMCVGDLAIVDGAATADKVITNLEVIPTMVQNLLEARVAKARDKVRRYVQGMTQDMSENAKDHIWLVARMQQIPKEAVQMAGDAVAAAAKECEAHAFKQLEVALSALQERDQKGALGLLAKRHQSAWAAIQGDDGSKGCVAWEVGHDPWRLYRTVEQAIAVVQNQDNIPQSITNQVVADELLRARIRSGGAGDKRATASGVQSRGGGGPAAAPKPSPTPAAEATNPGSRGHPDLCRPCLFNAQGICSKGDTCAFCHVQHPKRPVRFDKLHRETLKRMSFRYLAGIMLPVLRQKCDNVELRSNPEALELLSSLWPHLERHAAQQQAGEGADRATTVERGQRGGAAENAAACGSERGADADGGEGEVAGAPPLGSAGGTGTGEARGPRKEGSFASVLQVMALRSLLATLVSKVPEEDPELRNLVEAILHRLQGQRTGPPGTAAAAPGTAAPAGLRRGVGRGRRGGARLGAGAGAPSCEDVPMGSLVTRRLVGVGGD